MNDVNRRRLLKTTGVGAVALGANSATGSPLLLDSGASTSQTNVLSTFTAATQSVAIGIDVPDPTVDPSTSKKIAHAATGDTVQGYNSGTITVDLFDFDGEILDNGRWHSTTDLALDLTNIIMGEELFSKISQALLDFDSQISSIVTSSPAGEAPLSDLIGLLVNDPTQVDDNTETVARLLFGLIAEYDDNYDNYSDFVITSSRTFTIEDVAAVLVPLIDSLNLNQTQANALQDLLALLESAAGLLDNTFLYDPTIDNVTNIIKGALSQLVDGVTVETFNDLILAAYEILTVQVGLVDKNTETFLQRVSQLIAFLGQLLYDTFTGFSLNLIFDFDLTDTVQRVSGDWDPRNGTTTVGADISSITLSTSGSLTLPSLSTTAGTAQTTIPEIELPFEAHPTSGTSGALTGSYTDDGTSTASATIVDNEFTLGLNQLDIAREVENRWDPASVAPNLNSILWDNAGTIGVTAPTWPDGEFAGSGTKTVQFDITNNGGPQDIGVTLEVLDSSGTVLDTEPDNPPKTKTLAADETATYEFTVDAAESWDETQYDSVQAVAAVVGDGKIMSDSELESILVDLDVPSIVEAVNPTQMIRNAINDDSGSHVLKLSLDFSNIDFTNTPADPTNLPEKLPNGLDVPRDLDNDGLFEDTSGDGTVNIFDVQTFFLDYQSTEASTYPAAYNFSGEDATQVGIFDVQGLFNKVTNK